MFARLEDQLEEYRGIVSRNEDLKSEERVLNAMLNNLKQLRELLIEKEGSFCDEDTRLRSSATSIYSDLKGSLRQRCAGIIDHLVHFKCIIECLATDVLNLESNIINDDEYVSLSLTYRQVELEILQAIRANQQRNELFLGMKDEELRLCLLEIEAKWRREHEIKRKLMGRLLLDHNNFVVDKTRHNLDQQQLLLNHRYQFITNLIKLS